MANFGHGTQIVNVTDTHTYELNEHDLESILMREEVKDLPVVVVSVAGAYRGGKSFLLNFFLRYLTSPISAQIDGSWLGEDSAPLSGFMWRSGSVRTTLGMLMWSEPIIVTRSAGDKVAIILLDTQGTFDSTSTVKDCSTIFALSTLLSSVQIYNLSANIQEDDLHYLQLFTEYGKMVKDQGSKAFQVLEFLVRDWQFPWEYSYGAAGGDRYLEEKLKITPTLPEEMQELRRHIRSCFEKVSCFLMPHPGFKVLSPTFKGNISDISPDFRNYLKELVTFLFSQEKMMIKTNHGEPIKARELFNYFKSYMTLFNSGAIPNPTTLFTATVEAGLLSLLNEACEIYEKGMDSECGLTQLSMPTVDIQELHVKYVAKARETFTNKKKMGSKEDVDKYLVKLLTELDSRLIQYEQNNIVKTHAVIEKAEESYHKAIERISNGKPLCVHPLDLAIVHKAGLDAAKLTFDTSRKRITDKVDVDRTKLINSFGVQYDLLKTSNNEYNRSEVLNLSMEYWRHMYPKTALDSPLSNFQFLVVHQNALRKALADLKSNRTIASTYTDDVYRDSLSTKINTYFEQLNVMNSNKIDEIRQEEEQRKHEIWLEQVRQDRIREQQAARERSMRRRQWEREQEEQRRSRCTIL